MTIYNIIYRRGAA